MLLKFIYSEKATQFGKISTFTVVMNATPGSNSMCMDYGEWRTRDPCARVVRGYYGFTQL